MNILYDYQIFCHQQYGGISRYFYELANRIAGTQGYKAEIFAPLYINEYFQDNSAVRPSGIKIPKLSGVGRFAALAVDAVLAMSLIKSQHDVDIFHETYYSGMDCRPRTAKRVITVYDMIHEKFPSSSVWRNHVRLTKAKAVRRADHVICISQNTRRDLIELLDIPEEKTSVVYLGHSLATSRTLTPSTVSAKPYILYVGQRAGHKNFDRLLKAYAKSLFLKKDFSIICFGGGQISSRELALITSLGIAPDCVNHLSGADDVLAKLYASAAVFVYPSLYEGFGIPPLEAMSFGCPVTCSNTSSLPEVVGDAAELFDPVDENDICLSIEKIVSSSDRARDLVERGYDRVRRFSWEKCAQDTIGIYQKLL